MTFCSQLEDLDAMVMGELDARRARELRAHAATCRACTAELEMLAAERALFAARAEALEPREAFEPRSAVKMRRSTRLVLPALGRLAMRGHFTAACAAALFVVAGLSRVGTSSMAMSMASDDRALATSADTSEVGAGMFSASLEREPLACAPSSDDGVTTASLSAVSVASYGSSASNASRASAASGPSRSELLACVAGAGRGAGALESASGGVSPRRVSRSASCEPSVTRAGLRQ